MKTEQITTRPLASRHKTNHFLRFNCKSFPRATERFRASRTLRSRVCITRYLSCCKRIVNFLADAIDLINSELE
jgi:hypothetical protein